MMAPKWPNCSCLYHFTDRRNIPSIRRHGLLSWAKLERRGIEYVPASNRLSRDLDVQHDLQNYVRLCLHESHPMLHVAQNDSARAFSDPVWIEVDSAVIRWRSTRFSDENATASDVIVGPDPWLAFSSQSNQAEVLIEGSLAPRWLTFP